MSDTTACTGRLERGERFALFGPLTLPVPLAALPAVVSDVCLAAASVVLALLLPKLCGPLPKSAWATRVTPAHEIRADMLP